MEVAKTDLRERGSLGSDTAADLRPGSYQDSILTLCPLRTSASFLLIAVAFPTSQEVWLLTYLWVLLFTASVVEDSLTSSTLPFQDQNTKSRDSLPQVRGSQAWSNQRKPRMGSEYDKGTPKFQFSALWLGEGRPFQGLLNHSYKVRPTTVCAPLHSLTLTSPHPISYSNGLISVSERKLCGLCPSSVPALKATLWSGGFSARLTCVALMWSPTHFMHESKSPSTLAGTASITEGQRVTETKHPTAQNKSNLWFDSHHLLSLELSLRVLSGSPPSWPHIAHWAHSRHLQFPYYFLLQRRSAICFHSNQVPKPTLDILRTH